MNDSFCIRFWHSLSLLTPGTVKVCCWTQEVLRRDGVPMSLYHQSLEEIWNSPEMRQMRADIIAGKKLSMCDRCHEAERVTGRSERTRSNSDWLATQPPKRRKSLEQLAAESVANGHVVPNAPRLLHIELGNVCNLKCRMCSGSASSRIAADPVHSAWVPTAGVEPLVMPTINGQAVRRRFPDDQPWYDQKQFIERELVPPTKEVTTLYLIGGEPLIIPGFERLLDHLIAQEMTQNTALVFNTNASVAPPALLEKLARFRRPQLLISADGFGEVYDYIRYPAKWATIVKNIETLRAALPGAIFRMAVTVQVYNVLSLVDLYRFCDRIGIAFTTSRLTGPDWLELAVLPPRMRGVAIERLRAYIASDCRPEQVPVVQATIDWLEALGTRWNRQIVQQFMEFTNDLDASRRQSIRDSLPELYQSFIDAGIKWKPRLRHAVA